MIDWKTLRSIPYRWIPALLIIAVLLYLVATFVMQIGVSLELRDEVRQLDQKISVAERANAELESRLNYVSSDDAAEEWARQNGWARSDEVLVVVLAPEAEDALQEGLPQGDGVRPASNRDSWWDLFFGER